MIFTWGLQDSGWEILEAEKTTMHSKCVIMYCPLASIAVAGI